MIFKSLNLGVLVLLLQTEDEATKDVEEKKILGPALAGWQQEEVLFSPHPYPFYLMQ